jgi:hypothetical protein
MHNKLMTSAWRVRFLRRANCSLRQFLDNEGYNRVGRRIQHSQLPYDSIHQLILTPTHHFTEIVNEHLRLLHVGPQLLTASLRQQFWIPRMKQVICPVLHHCLPCFKLKAAAAAAADWSLTFGKSNSGTPIFKCWDRLCGSIWDKE